MVLSLSLKIEFTHILQIQSKKKHRQVLEDMSSISIQWLIKIHYRIKNYSPAVPTLYYLVCFITLNNDDNNNRFIYESLIIRYIRSNSNRNGSISDLCYRI